MPPKKRVTKQEEQLSIETPAKSIEKSAQVIDHKKQQSQPQSQPQPQVLPGKTQTQSSIPPSQSISSKPVEITNPQPLSQIALTQLLPLLSEKSQKISIDDGANITEQQKIRLRKLRFGSISTEATGQQADKIKQERLKKFGASNEEIQKDLVQKRKQKFANNNGSLVGENLQTLKKRLEKFGNTAAPATVSEDKDVVEERKKKFGNPETEVNLDEEIKKTKHIHKFQPKIHNRFQKKHGNNRR